MEDNEYSLVADIHGMRQLKSALEYLIQVWPGSPARPPEEQEMLWSVVEQLNRCELEHLMTLEINNNS